MKRPRPAQLFAGKHLLAQRRADGEHGEKADGIVYDTGACSSDKPYPSAGLVKETIGVAKCPRTLTLPVALCMFSPCLGAFVGFLCHGTAGLIGLSAAAVLSNIYEGCIENCGDYHVTVLLVILVAAHVIALMTTIVIVRRILRNIG